MLVVLVAVGLSGSATDSAKAAPCPFPTYGLEAGGELSIQGTSPCAEQAEEFVPYCSAGTVWFEYGANGVLQGQTDTMVACGTPTHLAVHGNAGDDTIDLSRVAASSGFSGITQPNLVDAGSGNDEIVGSPLPNDLRGGAENDIILARNGVHDAIDCGAGTDAAQGDQASIDSLSNCEVIDLLPTPLPAPTSTPPHTGKRAAAQRKCRKLKRRRARRKCFRHAKTLPI